MKLVPRDVRADRFAPTVFSKRYMLCPDHLLPGRIRGRLRDDLIVLVYWFGAVLRRCDQQILQRQFQLLDFALDLLGGFARGLFP